MGLVAIEITGTEKQGLGYRLIVDGKIWPAKINDPGAITFNRNRLDTTQTLNRASLKSWQRPLNRRSLLSLILLSLKLST